MECFVPKTGREHVCVCKLGWGGDATWPCIINPPPKRHRAHAHQSVCALARKQHPHRFLELLFDHDLDGHFDVGELVASNFDFCKATRPNGVSHI